MSITGESQGTSLNGEAGPPPVARRQRLTPRLVVALALAFLLAGAVFQVLDRQVRGDPAYGNRALADTETTGTVIGDVSNGLSKIFSYSPGGTASTAQAAAEVLRGPAAGQYTVLFAQVRQRAAAQSLTLRTRVARAGVIRLSGSTAQLLVFLDQTIIRRDRPQGTSAAAQLAVTARHEAGQWRIYEIHAR